MASVRAVVQPNITGLHNMPGSRLYAWNTNPTRSRRSLVSCRSLRGESSVPPIQICPLVTASSPAMQCISVDLPDPDGPITAINEPAGMSKLTASSAVTAAGPCP